MIIEYNHFKYEQEQQKLTKEKFPITLTHFKNSNCRIKLSIELKTHLKHLNTHNYTVLHTFEHLNTL